MRARSARVASSFFDAPPGAPGSTAVALGSSLLSSRSEYGNGLVVCTGPSALSRWRKSSYTARPVFGPKSSTSPASTDALFSSLPPPAPKSDRTADTAATTSRAVHGAGAATPRSDSPSGRGTSPRSASAM